MFKAGKISVFSTLLVLPLKEELPEYIIQTFRIPAKVDKRVAYREILKKIEEGKKRRIGPGALLLSPVYRIAISTAASLVLIFLLQLFLFSQTAIQSGTEVRSFRLPDKSRVVLSENSSVSYSKYYWNRKIKLQGEAYFEVKKGEKFTVKTDEGNVSVLGTRFLVSTNPNRIAVSCFEGKVVYTGSENQEIIPAGTDVVFSRNQLVSRFLLNETYPEQAIFQANFSAGNLTDVVRQLEDFFQVEIRLATTKNYLFTGSIETPDFESALKIISHSLGLHYSFEQNEVVLTEKRKEL